MDNNDTDEQQDEHAQPGAPDSNGDERQLPLVVPAAGLQPCTQSALAAVRPRQWRVMEAGRRPQKLNQFARAMHDYQVSAALYDLGPSVAMMDACIDDLLVRAAELEDREYRHNIRVKLDSARSELEHSDMKGGLRAVKIALKMAEDGCEYDKAMGRAVDYAERRNKLAKEARELACREAQTLTYRQATELCANVFAVVREVMGEDTETANLIISAVSKLVSAQLGMSVHGGATREEAAQVVKEVREEESAIDM